MTALTVGDRPDDHSRFVDDVPSHCRAAILQLVWVQKIEKTGSSVYSRRLHTVRMDILSDGRFVVRDLHLSPDVTNHRVLEILE